MKLAPDPRYLNTDRSPSDLFGTEPSKGFIITTMDSKKFHIEGASSAEEAIAEFQSRSGGLMQIESVTPDYSGADYAKGAARGAVMGGAMGLPMGGPVGGAVGAGGGAAGEMVAMGIEEAGMGGAGQFAGSMAADIGVSALARRPTASLLRRVPGVQEATEKGIEYLGKGGAGKRFLSRNWAAESSGYAARQAGKAISDLPTPGVTDPAVEVGESVRSGHQYMDDVYQSARKQAQKETLGMYGSAEGVIRKSDELLQQFEYMDEVPSVLRKAAKLPQDITLQEAENLRKGVGAAYSRGVVDPKVPHYRKTAALYEPLDETLDDIASHSDIGETSVQAVKKMREARKAMHQQAPESGLMYRTMISEGRMDNAQKALDRIFSSDRAVAEVKLIRGMMGDAADDIALRRAAITHVLQRRVGMGAQAVASSPQSGGAAIGKASSEAMALTEILGERGYGNLMDILDDVARPGRGSTPFSARMPMAQSGMSKPLLILAGASGAGGVAGDSTAAQVGGAVLALGGIVEAFMRQNGREAVANLALAALVDPDIYRQIAIGAGARNAEAAAVRLGQTLVRRVLFTEDEIGGE
jgi:hypothetical protein